MRTSRKILVALAATSAVVAPVAASAASAAASARAGSAVSGESDLEGNSSWIIGLVGLLAGVAAIILVSDNDDDAPVSP
jgi:putative cell wall-binding protein